MLRQAQIAKYLNLLYEDSFQDWQKKRHDQLLDIARHAMALQNFRAEKMPPGATTLETFADFRDWKAAHPDEAEEYQRQFDEADGAEIPERPQDQQGSPQSRLCPFHAGRIPDAPDVAGVDDARPDGRANATRSWKSPR